jgi:hypothetical protein
MKISTSTKSSKSLTPAQRAAKAAWTTMHSKGYIAAKAKSPAAVQSFLANR